MNKSVYVLNIIEKHEFWNKNQFQFRCVYNEIKILGGEKANEHEESFTMIPTRIEKRSLLTSGNIKSVNSGSF